MYDKISQAKYRTAHKKERALYCKLWRKRNVSRRAIYRTLWNKDNPEIRAFVIAKQRCNNTKHPFYSYYGGRGIKFLYKSSAEFIDDIGHRPSSEYSLDRINNNGHYEVGNCRWATRSQQSLNKRKFKHSRLTARYTGGV